MSIKTDTIVLDNMYTGKSVSIIILTQPTKWYGRKPLPVVDASNVTILWDFPIRTDRRIQANRPDIVIKQKQNKTCQVINMSVPSDSNISAKEFEKLSKYKDLEIETAETWKMKAKPYQLL